MSKFKDNEALRFWDNFKRELEQSATVTIETRSQKALRIKELEADPEAWFRYYFPNYYKSDAAEFHKKATRRLIKNKRWYEVRAWSRELAKSARIMFETFYLVLVKKDVHVVLLISNSEDNATRLLTPFRINFEKNPRLKNDYGKLQHYGNWTDSEFTTTAGTTFRALGAGQSPRGTRAEEKRPDLIIIDDIDTDIDCRNPKTIKQKWNWIEQALIPTVSVSGNYRIIFNGNVIAKDCCITRAMDKAKHVDVVNIRDSKGKSTWPQKNSEQDIDDILSNVSSASAQKEYFNNPVTEGEIFKSVKWGEVPDLAKFKRLILYGDPASSNKEVYANKALILIGDLNNTYYVIKGFLDKATNNAFVDTFFQFYEYVGTRSMILSFLENNTLQDPFFEQVFVPLFFESSRKKGFMVGIRPDTRKKPDKFTRIEGTLEPLNRLGRLVFNEAEKSDPNMQRIVEQLMMVEPGLPAPADGPDAIEGAIYIAQQKNKLDISNHSIGRRTGGTKKY
jgi:hypothetical protein